MLRYHFLLFLLLVSTFLTSQSISGFVRNASGNTIVFASVVASGCVDDRILAFTNTNDQGFYKLGIKTDCDSITLTARALGYKTVALTMAVNNLQPSQNFVMEGAVLQEVLIRGKTPPVVVRNDTTEYNVASFSDSTEFSVEDLLKKLPGAQVSESGRITLNGKEVERVLIEGDDLFNQNYQIATRNVRANMISKVQAIDKYQENPLMKGVQESERLVLNLKIKEEKKRSLSGSANLGLGHGDETKLFGHLNLFSFTKTDKTYLIGNANNTGFNALGSIQGYSDNNIFDRNRQNLQSNPLRAGVFVQNPNLETAGLPPVFSRTNHTGLVYLGHIMPITPALKVRISGWLGQERLQQQANHTTRYLLDNGNFDIMENRDVEQQAGLQNLQVEMDYFFPDKKQSLRSFILINGSPDEGMLQLLRSSSETAPERIVQQLNGRLFQSLAAFEYTLKTSESSALQITLKDAHYQGNQVLAPEYRFYGQFFGLDSSFIFLRQQVGQRQHVSTLTARYLARKWSLNWVLEGGIYGEWNRLQSDVWLENNVQTRRQAGDDFRNDLHMLAPQPFARASAYREFGSWYISGAATATYYPIMLQNKGNTLDAARLLPIEPQLNLRYTLNEKTAVSLHYGYQQKLPRFSDYTPAYVFSDYQSAQRGLPEVRLMPGHQASVRLYFINRLKQYGWNVSVSGSRKDNQLGGEFQINPYIFIQDLYRPVRSAHYSINSGAHRYFPALSSRFEAGFNVIGLQQENKINSDIPRNLDSRIYTVSLEYGSAFDGWVNLILKNQFFHSIAENSREQFSSTFTATSWQSSAQVVIKPSKRFSTKLNIYRFANRTDQMPYNVAYAAQGECLWLLPALHSSIQLSGVNLFGSRQFRQVAADAFIQSTSSVQAVTPFFLVTWDYSF